MSLLEDLESQVKELSPKELAAFREWFAQFDAEVWDRQFEADVKSGKLDNLAERALRDHNAGRSTDL
jgi:hypothetical protein